MGKKRLNLFLGLGWIVAGICLFIIFKNFNLYLNEEAFEDQQKKYPMLSKRVLQEFPQDILINFLTLRKEVRSQVAPYGNTFGFYFEYLPTGTSIGVNEKNEFYAASLFKVPVIMAYYKYLERIGSREELSKEITIEESDLDMEYGDLWRQGAGAKIKMSDAISLALEKSDNTAAIMIAKRVSQDDFDAVYEGIDIELNTASNGAVLTAKNYTSILKALYFSAVLEKDDSNQILKYLSNTNFSDKLDAGVPENVVVAHKIGEYEDENRENTAFMDCGIVYVPKRPYVLCMISVSQEETARKRMKMLSKTIYDYVSSVE